jgi:hypothetical protein
MYKTSIRTSQETGYVCTIKIDRLFLFREEIAAYSENLTKHTSALCGQKTEFQYVKVTGIYSDHFSLKG